MEEVNKEIGRSSQPDEVQVESLKKYQEEIQQTFKTHPYLTPEQTELLDWSLGIGGEAGEVQEIIKHHIFSGEPLDKMKLAKEMGDTLWYLAALATATGIHMEDIAGLNIHKLRHRYHNQGYNKQFSADRHEREEKFIDTAEYRNLKYNILGVK